MYVIRAKYKDKSKYDIFESANKKIVNKMYEEFENCWKKNETFEIKENGVTTVYPTKNLKEFVLLRRF
jgi:hypothetical protein